MDREELLAAIRKGADYIENDIHPAHSNYKRAMEKYDDYVAQLLRMDRPAWLYQDDRASAAIQRGREMIERMRQEKKAR